MKALKRVSKTQRARSKKYRENHPDVIRARRSAYQDLVRMKINFYNTRQKENMFEIEYYI
jgi:hypothetical protein